MVLTIAGGDIVDNRDDDDDDDDDYDITSYG